MRYCERQPLAYSIVVCGTFLLLAAVPAAAQGIGPPAGLLEVFLVFWGLCGIVAGVLLGVAFLLEKRRPRSFIAIALVLIALCYSVTAIPCFFLESEGGASKFTGAVGLVVLSFVARYFFRERRSWALGSYALIGLALVALLLIPNAYWEMPLVSFTRIVYEDNLAGAGDSARVLRSPYGYGGRLALDDGRLLIQTQYIPERPRYRGQSETPTYLNGVAVVLEPVTSTEPGNWYEIQHYDPAYVPGAYYDGQRARYVLGLTEKRVDTYRRSSRTLGFLVDESAPVSAEDIVIGMMSEQYGSWSDEPDRQDPGNKRHWAQLLVERGDIDLLSPPFLDRAFGAGVESYGLIGMWPLGMSPVAQDSRGNTILHVAAARCDGRLLRFLGDKAIEATIRNARERTALEIMRIRTAENPRECAAAERYFEEQLIP